MKNNNPEGKCIGDSPAQLFPSFYRNIDQTNNWLFKLNIYNITKRQNLHMKFKSQTIMTWCAKFWLMTTSSKVWNFW